MFCTFISCNVSTPRDGCRWPSLQVNISLFSALISSVLMDWCLTLRLNTVLRVMVGMLRWNMKFSSSRGHWVGWTMRRTPCITVASSMTRLRQDGRITRVGFYAIVCVTQLFYWLIYFIYLFILFNKQRNEIEWNSNEIRIGSNVKTKKCCKLNQCYILNWKLNKTPLAVWLKERGKNYRS